MKQSALNNFNKGMTRDLGKTVPQLSTYLEGRNIRIIANEDSLESGIVVNVDGNAFSFKLEGPCPPLSFCYEAWAAQEDSWAVYDGSTVPATDTYVHYVPTGTIYFYTGGVDGSFDHTRHDECGPMPSAADIEASLGLCTYDAIGWTTIRDTLYVFATNDLSLNPGGVDTTLDADPSSSGAIFKIEFNSQTNSASSIEIVYVHPELNLTKRHQIEAIGRYESKNVQRLYWTDNFNTVRTLNIKDPNIENLTPEDLDINPSVSLSMPEVVGVMSSGELPAGMYQYAYRLRSASGSETRFSPFTGFLHVVQASEGGTDYWTYSEDPEDVTEYVGTAPGVLCSKSVRLKIDNLDLDYDTLEVAAIYKTTKEGISSSYIFARQSVTATSTEVVHSSSSAIIGLVSLTELTTFNYNIKKAKTLSTKDNRLFLGNVVTPLEELPFNARAIRYRRGDSLTNVHHDYDSSGVIMSTYMDEAFDEHAAYVKDPDLYPSDFEFTVEENLDAINPYNELMAINRSGDSYKYQKDGVTLGGEGPHVSYTFVKKVISGDNYVEGVPSTAAPFIDVSAEDSTCTTGTDWLDYKNPVMVEGFKGYQRDEVYRFAIVLHDLQGNPGFANWAGDIRFPAYKDFDTTGGADLYNFSLSQTRSKANAALGTDYSLTGSQSGASYGSDLDPNGALTGVATAIPGDLSWLGSGYGKNTDIDTHEMYALGVEFTVNIPDSIKPFISGYSIVRVERLEIDKTVLGLGMGSWMYRFGDKEGSSLGETFQFAHSAYMSTWKHGDVSSSYDHGELRNNIMNMDSPDFVLTGKYPTASECDWVQVVGSLSTGASRNAWENDFKFDGANTGTDDDFYRKMYTHQVAYQASPENPEGAIFMEGSSNTSPDANGSFFKPSLAKKFPSGGSLPGGDLLDNGINNIGVEVNGTDSQDTYSIGCDTLYMEFKGYMANGEWVGDAVPMANGAWQATAFPYWEYWINPATGEDNPNQIYFNSNEEYDDDVSYFTGSTAYDTSRSGAESDPDDRHNNPWGRSKVQAKPLLAWRRERPTQYGGNTYEARSRSVYMSAGVFVPANIEDAYEYINPSGIPSTHYPSTDVWGGDMFVHFYDFQKMRRWQSGQSPDDAFTNGAGKKHSFSFAIPVESTINIGLRTGYHFANKDNFTGKQNDDYQLDQYEYDQVYSAEADLQQFYPRPYNYVESDEYDSRVLYSQLKTNGDKVDSWRQFKMDDYRDVDGAYGPINKLTHFSDTIYYLQDRGIGRLSINPVAITTATDQSSIVLGTGAVIQDSKYLSTGVGCKHQWSVLSTNKGLYWLDILTNSIYKINSEGTMELSRVKGMKSYFEGVLEGSEFSNLPTGDNPVYHSGVTTGFDSKNNEVLFSFLKRELVLPDPSDPHGKPELEITLAETLVYSETTGTFTSFYDFASPFLIDTQDKLLSIHPSLQHNVFLHNAGELGSWYGIVYDSVLKYIVNQFPTETKVFDSLVWHMEGGVWSAIYSETDYQEPTGGLMESEVNMWRRERTWRSPIARAKDLSRLRDKYVIHTFIYDNTRTLKFRAHYIETKFRVSKR